MMAACTNSEAHAIPASPPTRCCVVACTARALVTGAVGMPCARWEKAVLFVVGAAAALPAALIILYFKLSGWDAAAGRCLLRALQEDGA